MIASLIKLLRSSDFQGLRFDRGQLLIICRSCTFSLWFPPGRYERKADPRPGHPSNHRQIYWDSSLRKCLPRSLHSASSQTLSYVEPLHSPDMPTFSTTEEGVEQLTCFHLHLIVMPWRGYRKQGSRIVRVVRPLQNSKDSLVDCCHLSKYRQHLPCLQSPSSDDHLGLIGVRPVPQL